jgi:hypothetical protein
MNELVEITEARPREIRGRWEENVTGSIDGSFLLR